MPLGIAGFFAGLYVLGDPDKLFWGFSISPAYAKVTFTITLAAMAYLMFVMLRSDDKGADRCPVWNARITVGLAAAAFVGGGITSLTGTGVNVMLFLFIVLMAGLHPRVGVPTSILTMASLSIVGFLTLSIADGQFDLGLQRGRRDRVGRRAGRRASARGEPGRLARVLAGSRSRRRPGERRSGHGWCTCSTSDG